MTIAGVTTKSLAFLLLLLGIGYMNIVYSPNVIHNLISMVRISLSYKMLSKAVLTYST